MSQRKFAVFDIDGTLYRWQLYHELVERLSLDGIFPAEATIQLDEAWNMWRGGEISFDKYEKVVVGIMTTNLPNISIADFEKACDFVVKDSSHKTHYYTRSLLKNLKSKDYFIIAITGSQQELIDRFGKKYGFDAVVGAQYERKDGGFTGETKIVTIGKKPAILRDLVLENNLTWDDSYAIGDSDGDASLLEMVQNPIAFNPSIGLLDRAKNEGWPIVVERKNIAYEFAKRGDDLILSNVLTY